MLRHASQIMGQIAVCRLGQRARICLACLNPARSYGSPKKPKENPQSLAKKQMWRHNNSLFAELDHSEAYLIVINSKSNSDR
jgi:hypothetical protein